MNDRSPMFAVGVQGKHSPFALSQEDASILRSLLDDLKSKPRSAKHHLTHGIYARRLIRERRQRDAILGAGLFADPAWDILLDLFAAHEEGKSVSVSSACIASAVPATTGLRWVETLVQRSLVLRSNDARDGRRVNVRLSPNAVSLMRDLIQWMMDR